MRAAAARIFAHRILRAACWIAVLGACAVPSWAVEPVAPPAPVSRSTDLPDAPDVHLSSDSDSANAQFAGIATTPAEFAAIEFAPLSPPAVQSTAPQLTRQERDAACQSGSLHGKPCRVHWLPILWQSFEVTTLENGGNIVLDKETRQDLTDHPYWSTYVYCVKHYRFDQWSDDTPFIVHDIAHPMQGAIVYSIFEQNDPKSRGLPHRLPIHEDGIYWRAHLKAMGVVTLYELQWKLGPASEASIGNSGWATYYTPRVKGRTTNETGFEDFFITPVYGLGWNITEEIADRFLMPRIWHHTHNKWVLAAASVLTPCKAAANLLRYKPIYYRDFPITPVR